MNNNNKKKEIRVVALSGRYKFKYCEVDEEGWADRILRDEVDISFRSMKELKELITALQEASAKPIVHQNAANARMLGVEDYF